MTPEEKVEELIEQFLDYSCRVSVAKKSAITCVDNILNALIYTPVKERQTVHIKTLDYWKKVKTYIETL